MRKNLLEFLFGEEVVPKHGDDLGENIVKMFEEADELEAVEMVADKKPLADALSDIGVKGTVDPSYQMAEIRFTDANEYREAVRLLSEPENVHKLAELGWVATRGDGDIAMSNEPAEYKLNFIEISVASDLENKEKAPDLEKVLKQGQEFAVKPVDRDDEMNPVDNTRSDKKGEKQAGVGKAKDGEAPEGKPKGSTKKTESMLESTEKCPKCGSHDHEKGVKNFGSTKTGADKPKPEPMRTCNKCGHKWKPAHESKAVQLANRLLESSDAADLGSTRTQAPFFRTDKNLGLKKKGKVTEMTAAAAIPAVESPMPVQSTYRDKLQKLKKRRDPSGLEK